MLTRSWICARPPFVVALLTTALPACATGGGSGGAPSGPAPVFAYHLPSPNPLRYDQADTVRMNVNAGPAGELDIGILSAARLSLFFAEAEEGLNVTATYDDLEARMTNPLGPATSVTEAEIDGPIVFRIDATGRGELIEAPGTLAEAGQLVNPANVVQGLLRRVPGRPVPDGYTWTDTTDFEQDQGEVGLSSRTILTHTLVGDSTALGRTLKLFRASGTVSSQVEGGFGDAPIDLSLEGTTEGLYLWDAARGVLVFSEFDSEMSGTIEPIGAGMPPLAIRARGTSWTRLVEGGSPGGAAIEGVPTGARGEGRR